MKKGLLPYILLLHAITVFTGAVAQDPHFTQAQRIPAWYNPASAGQGVEHIRLTMLYRNQWASVSSPFRTPALFFDKNVNHFGFGAMLVNNSAGEAGFRQLYLNGQLAYRHAFGKHLLSSGIQIGFVNKSFDPSKMTFDDQYQPDQGFNASNPTTETFSYSSLTRPSFGAGLQWGYGDPRKDHCLPYAGIAIQHLNQPKESFIEQDNFIPRKLTAQAGVGIRMSEHLILTPAVIYAQQQFAHSVMGSVMAKIPLEDRSNVEGGIIYRNRDAVAVFAGYQWNSFMLGVSYDANISGLGRNAGAFELSLTYIPKAKQKKEPAKCEKSTKPARAQILNEESAGKPAGSSEPATKPATVKTDTASKSVGKGISQTPKVAETKTAAPVKTTGTNSIYKQQDKPAPASATSTKGQAREESIKPIATTPVASVPAPEIRKPAPATLPDSDRDGVPDQIDPCPYMAGSTATQGCPDTDGDGVVDTKDKCPMEKGDAAHNGCAIPSTGSVKGPVATWHFGNIEFKTGSSEVHGLYKLDIIEPALDSLFKDETYRLVITGHTDSEGDAPFNMMLSQSRADVVKAIFLKKGLEEGRITTVAYGENMPLQDNRLEEGRQHNRRVEVHIIRNDHK